MISSGGQVNARAHLSWLHDNAGLGVNEATRFVIDKTHRLVNVSTAGAQSLILAVVLGSFDIVVGTWVPRRHLFRARQMRSLASICTMTG